MKTVINVPTLMRAGNMETWRIFPGADYWIHEGEIEDYKREHKGIKVRPIPDKLRGNVARVRNYILDNQKNKKDACLMLDDDMIKFGFFYNKKPNYIEDSYAFSRILEKYNTMALDLGVNLWGVNCNQDKQSYREYTPFSMLSYISASFSVFMPGNDLRYDERFSLKEDYDMTIQQLLKFRKVLRVNNFFYVKRSAEQKGGCALYRNIAKENNQIKMLQKKWGVKIVRVDKQDRSHNTSKKKTFDINPIIRVPIKGV